MEEIEESLDVYPNPSPGIFQISVENIDMTQFDIKLLSLAGQQLPIRIREKAYGTLEIESTAESGIYMLQIRQGEFEVIRKVVIRH